jgi:hypothetical protein
LRRVKAELEARTAEAEGKLARRKEKCAVM